MAYIDRFCALICYSFSQLKVSLVDTGHTFSESLDKSLLLSKGDGAPLSHAPVLELDRS